MFITAIVFLAINCEQSFEITPKNPTDNSMPSLPTRSIKLSWQDQLQNIINTPPVTLAESGISLLEYNLIDTINNDTKLNKYKLAIKKDDNMIPCYTPSLKNICAITKREAKMIRSKNQKYTFEDIES